MIESGTVRLLKRNAAGLHVELLTLGPCQSFGEGSILTTLPRAASAQAVRDAVLHKLSSISFYHLYQVQPGQYGILILNIARDLARRLRLLDEKFAACQ
jgi:CRP-like cAMP-binding protein